MDALVLSHPIGSTIRETCSLILSPNSTSEDPLLKDVEPYGDISRFSVNNIRPMADLEWKTDYETFVPPPNENVALMGDNEVGPSIDHNRGFMENS